MRHTRLNDRNVRCCRLSVSSTGGHYELLDGRLRQYYLCNEAVVRHAGKHCQWARGTAVDEAMSALLLQTVAPAAIEVALSAHCRLTVCTRFIMIFFRRRPFLCDAMMAVTVIGGW
jgi:hypothetical protein